MASTASFQFGCLKYQEEPIPAKWEEMFGVKEEVVEEVKVKKPRRKG